MGSASYKVKVPGSLMLFGEHAVLHSKLAMVAAIDRYIEVTLTLRSDRLINIVSPNFGEHSLLLDKFKISKRYSYVLMAIKQYLPQIKCGFDLTIAAEFSSTIGFGSSAAVTVATLAVLERWLVGGVLGRHKLYRLALRVIRSIQGFGSGADVAASVFGGVIAYKMAPTLICKLNVKPPLVAIYSGKKVATAKVVEIVEKKRQKMPRVFAALYQAMDLCTRRVIAAINKKNYLLVGQLMDVHQGLQDALGVSNSVLSALIFSLRNMSGIYGAKISGAGLGDCIIGLGKVRRKIFPQNEEQKKNGVKQFDVNVSSRGIIYL